LQIADDESVRRFQNSYFRVCEGSLQKKLDAVLPFSRDTSSRYPSLKQVAILGIMKVDPAKVR